MIICKYYVFLLDFFSMSLAPMRWGLGGVWGVVLGLVLRVVWVWLVWESGLQGWDVGWFISFWYWVWFMTVTLEFKLNSFHLIVIWLFLILLLKIKYMNFFLSTNMVQKMVQNCSRDIQVAFILFSPKSRNSLYIITR